MTYFEVVAERGAWLAFRRLHPDASEDEFQQRWGYPEEEDAASKAKHHDVLMNNCLMSLGNDHRDEAHDEEIEIAFAAGYHRAYHEVLTAICLVEAGVPLRKPTREKNGAHEAVSDSDA